MSRDWLTVLAELRQRGEAAVLVTLMSVRGSTPREAGVKMVVSQAAAHGTIGGGNLEFQSIRRARAMLAGGAPVVAEFPLGPSLGQCCGGHASVLFEPVLPPAWQIAVYGAGHVGRALVELLATLDCRVAWIDGRAGAFPDLLAGNIAPHMALPPAELPPGSYVLILTHDHALDFELVSQALPLAQLPFVGLIGSETKRARFVSRLAKSGMPPEAIKRLVCPIGLSGTGGKAPAEIAISVAAQLLQLRNSVSIAVPASAAPGCAGCDIGCAAEGEFAHDA